MPKLERALAAGLLFALSFAAPAAHGQDEGEEFHFSYDQADNLLSRTVVRDGVATEQAMPLDGSARNRPSSVGGVLLEWDANGNLKRKGDLYFAFDSRNRMTEVRDSQGAVLASYVYDAFNRRVEQHIGGDVITTVWAGQRPIETYVNGTLQTRRTFGLGLDEIVSVEHDLDGDGVLEQRYTPIYDSSGNLAVVTDENGKPIERYSFSPYGGRKIYVDLTPPRIEQVRVVQGELWLEISDMVSSEALTTALGSGEVRLEAAPEIISLSLDTTVLHAKRHRVELQLSSPPPAGTSVTLHVEPDAILDSFHNKLAQGLVVPFPWPSEDAVVLDTGPPEVYHVAYRDAVPEVEFTEEIDLSTATPSIQIAGHVTLWTKSEDGYRLIAGAPVPEGTHDLYVTESLSDLSGKALSEQFYLQLHVYPSTPAWVAYRAEDERLTPESTIANEFGFHGLPEDPVTGFLYARNRHYDPHLGRFISSDPLGYVDGPNAYQFARNNPVDFHDPLGLESADIRRRQLDLGRVGIEAVDPELGEYRVDVLSAFLGNLAGDGGSMAQGGLDSLSQGNSALLREGYRAYSHSQGSLGQRLAAGYLVGDHARLAVQTFGFSQAEDPRAHARGLGYGALGGVQIEQGSNELAIGFVEGDLARIASGTAQIWGGAGQTVLLFAGPKAVRTGRVEIDGALRSSVERATSAGGREATGVLGSRRAPLSNAPYQPLQNADAVIGGRTFSGHALDQMRNRGLTPSVIEDTVQTGVRSADPIPGRVRFYDPVNDVSVILEGERVVTARPGGF